MPVRNFGIYLVYGPRVDLRTEGLGRLLVAFLKAAASRDDVRFVIACPQWSRRGLRALLESEGIPEARFDVVSTDSMPFMLRIFLALHARKRSARMPSRVRRMIAWIQSKGVRHRQQIERQIASTHNVMVWFLIAVYVAILGALLLPLLAIVWLGRTVLQGRTMFRSLMRWAKTAIRMRRPNITFERLLAPISEPGEEGLLSRLYRSMEHSEAERLMKKINALQHVKAWYCPAAFWPAFNRIAAPRLMCVPDVLPTEFPAGFGMMEAKLVKNLEIVEQAIAGSEHLVTYSSRVKWDTLVDRYSVNPAAVDVVPHACWDLSPSIKVSGFPDAEAASRSYCEWRLGQALARLGSPYATDLSSGSIRFLFYPSQIRPNKNVLTLLRAYEHLLRHRFMQHKLILTGDPHGLPAVEDFIREHFLSNDVLCLHCLTASELAACYKLADLAVNPSLSEGGCPFTLTEALSVDTPVVMARIAVTEEVIVDPALREMMLFDPYDWQDAASRIEWALEHRETLLSAQKELYAALRQRTWRSVVDDYVAILDRIAQTPERVQAAGR